MNRHTISSSVVLVVTLLIALFYTIPLMANDGQLENTLAQERQEHFQKQQKLDHAKEIQTSMNTLTEMEKKRLISQVPLTVDQEGIIQILSSVSAQSGVVFSSVSFSKITTESPPKKVSVLSNFSGTGSIEPFLRLLQFLERSDRLFTVKQLAVTLSPNRGDYSITLESYYIQ